MMLDPSCRQEDIQIRFSISLRWVWELQLTLYSPCLVLNFILAKKNSINSLHMIKVKLLKQAIIRLPSDKKLLPSVSAS